MAPARPPQSGDLTEDLARISISLALAETAPPEVREKMLEFVQQDLREITEYSRKSKAGKESFWGKLGHLLFG